MTRPASPRWDSETMLVAWLAGCISLVSFLFYLRQGDVLLYGDAVAHINIARRVFDSRTPGLLQLGTVWLPLPHLVMIPFLLSDWLWQTGIGGSIPSLIAYVFATVGIFRLVHGALREDVANVHSKTAAWLAALIFAANPNLIYLQTTAMTEALYLALFIWAVVHFSDFAKPVGAVKAKASLWKCAACIFGACLTRYDGWFLAVTVIGTAVAFMVYTGKESRALHRTAAAFVLVTIAAPMLWLAYNAVVYRNPLEFANGPYSAKAIEEKTTPAGAPRHPGTGNVVASASYFIKAGELTMMEGNWHRLWLLLAVLGSAGIFAFQRRVWSLLLLWSPAPFYTLSIAHGGVPIFIPPWWPYTLYNARYGVELLPAFAVFATVAFYLAAKFVSHPNAKAALGAALLLFAAASYFTVWRAQPVAFREAWTNSRTRIAIERALANTLTKLPHDSTLLMYLGDHPGALEQAGIPLRRLIYEGNHRTWKQPADPEGLWERALANPSQFADYVLAADGDAVDLGVSRQQLTALAVIHVTGQPRIVLYSTARSLPSR